MLGKVSSTPTCMYSPSLSTRLQRADRCVYLDRFMLQELVDTEEKYVTDLTHLCKVRCRLYQVRGRMEVIGDAEFCE